jgi:3-deoxy-D-manno-octulosonate 8-phosphate phosphatase (KDO 8-P phosphatase)
MDGMVKIRLFLTDVDGVLTDCGMYYTESGDEFKKFNTRDGMAFELLRKAGIKTGIITSENTQIVARRAAKIKADYLYQGHRDGSKLTAALEICKKEGISLHEVAYIGDDLNCIGLLEKAGLAACPADAVAEVKAVPGIRVMASNGGAGCVREFVEMLLKTNEPNNTHGTLGSGN